MTMQSVPISSVGRNPTTEIDTDDLSSVATPPIGYRTSSEDQEFVSKTIRFSFAPSDRSRINSIHPSEVHTQWIKLIHSAFGDDVKIISNSNRPVTNLDTSPTANRTFSYAQQFKVHTRKLNNSTTQGGSNSMHVIVHRILTRVPFGQIKRQTKAYQLLLDNQCFLHEHLWDEQEWDLKQLGFVTGFNPKYYSNERVTTMFRARLSKAMPRKKIPKFQMVLKSHRIHHNGRTSKTQAYAIELPSHVAPQLIPILKEVTKDTTEFVAFQMRKRNPEAFQGAIRYQNHTLSIQQVIAINYIGKDAMYYLTDRIQSIVGVIDVVPTRNEAQTGRYFVIVNKEDDQRVREKLHKKFKQWYEDAVPDDARPKPDQYTGTSPEIGNVNSDGFSEGDNSWMTNSTRSFMSFSVASMKSDGNTDELYLDQVSGEDSTKASTRTNGNQKETQPKITKQTATYAAAAGATSVDQISGITESEPSPIDAKHEELNLRIASLEAMIMALVSQVQLLTSQTQESIVPRQHPKDPSERQEKRQDIKSTPRKAKRPHDQTADLVAKDGSHNSATQNEDRPTVWDDYSDSSNHE